MSTICEREDRSGNYSAETMVDPLEQAIISVMRENRSLGLDELLTRIKDECPDSRAIRVKIALMRLIEEGAITIDENWKLYSGQNIEAA